jgi:very-short-patch-repair endonuclease
VTPFRKQADRINDAVSGRFGSRLPATWKLQVHTADGFQGDERDIILFSLCGGPDMPVGSRNFLAGDANRFNVAVSRARSVLRVFGNLEWAKDCGISHIQALAERCVAAEGGGRSVRTDLIGPIWEARLAEALRAAGIDFEQQYQTCGFYLDFAIVRDDVRIDVEVDGETYHRSASGGRRIEDLYRDHLLIAAGWKVLRFWVYELRENLDECIRRIQQSIADRA